MNILAPGENSSKTPTDGSSIAGQPADHEAPCRPSEHGVDHLIVRDLVAHSPCTSGTGCSSLLPLRVLIADDYADAAESLAMLLSNAGIETEVALDGEQALSRASKWRPHICVLDLEMPKLDGGEIARRIREQSWVERPLLIALTGWTAPQDRRSALEAGFDHFIMKPVDPVKLMRIIQNHLVRAPT